MVDDAEEPLLSNEETAALLDAMREDDAVSAAPEAQSTELASPEAPLREALGRADRAATAIARTARDQLLLQIARGVDTEALPGDIVPREVLASSLHPGALLYALRHDGELHGILSVDPSLAAFVLENSMGAGTGDAPAATLGQLTALDRSILEPLPLRIAAALGEGFLEGRRLEAALLDEGEAFDSGVRFEPMLRMAWRFSTAEGRVGELTVALTAAAVGRAPSGGDGGARPNARPARAALSERLTMAEVTLVAVLGRAPSCVRELLRLQPGDVLRLDGAPGDALPVLVEDVVVARGNPVVERGDLAIEVTRAK
jgi:flagellar motor switch protein FliM